MDEQSRTDARGLRVMRSKARGFAPLALVIVLGLAAIAAVVKLELHADASRRAQVTLAEAKVELWQLDNAAWNASTEVGGSPSQAHRAIVAGERHVEQALAQLRTQSPVAAFDHIERSLQTNFVDTGKIYAIGSTRGYGRWINGLMEPQTDSQAAVFALMNAANREYAASADQATALGLAGSSVAIALLLVAFSLVYRRAARSRAVAEGLAALHHADAITDALTGLRNRRALIKDLETGIRHASTERPLMLALFDLDGFKQYNDTFGHAAGDALLRRLASALLSACEHGATAYRMGGDEFCVLAQTDQADGQALLADAKRALSEQGDRWQIGCSAGVVWLPQDGGDASAALGLADVRMYAEKAGRASAGRQAADALLRVLSARDPGMQTHVSNVALHARATARTLGLPDHDVDEITIAAELHDVGTAAIPDAVLHKPGPLDPHEWELVRRHTLLGERIMQAVPALGNAARLVRSSHERFDGTGYPDGLAGDQIPLGSRIVAVCEAFDAMTSPRPYKPAVSEQDALGELRRCAGTQFAPHVVEVFCTSIEAGAAIAA
jgi:diguanylate cyclase (GGDEF)-like protein